MIDRVTLDTINELKRRMDALYAQRHELLIEIEVMSAIVEELTSDTIPASDYTTVEYQLDTLTQTRMT